MSRWANSFSLGLMQAIGEIGEREVEREIE
jgi:hypothetical protein